MMIDLSMTELRIILDEFEYVHDHTGLTLAEVNLRDKVLELYAMAEELERMDFDECEGGGCKL